jgi:hypothetical protein
MPPVFRVNLPLLPSMGLDASTPLYASTDPAAPDTAENEKVYAEGSDEPATL